MPRVSSTQSQPPIDAQLCTRRSDLEETAFARIRAITDPSATPDPLYLAGLRAAVNAALDYGLAAISSPAREAPPVPVALLSQARLAARNKISLETVLRRCSSVHLLLTQSLLEEASSLGLAAADIKVFLRSLAVHYDKVLAAVTEEYGREVDANVRRPAHHRVRLLRQQLAGEFTDVSALNYDFGTYHLALVASGPSLKKTLLILAGRLRRRLLCVQTDEGTVWAWLGGRQRFRCEEINLITAFNWPAEVTVGLGEAIQGLTGWRLSHRQATSAHTVARMTPEKLVSYEDVALVTSVLQDDLLSSSLRRRYLSPLEAERDAGATAKDTLRAYFAAGGNVSSAAVALGVTRTTVRSRLLVIEERLERSIDASRPELDIALRLDRIEHHTAECRATEHDR